jgi:glutathione S-transferase
MKFLIEFYVISLIGNKPLSDAIVISLHLLKRLTLLIVSTKPKCLLRSFIENKGQRNGETHLMLELYHNDISPCAQKVRIILVEKGLTWTSHELDLQAGDQFKPEYAKLNPKSVVPTLVHDGEPIIESTIIAEYLDDVFPEIALRPKDPVELARMRWWAKQLDDGAHMSIGMISFGTTRRHQLKSKMTLKELENHLNNIPNENTRHWQRQVIEQGVKAPLLSGAVKLYFGHLQQMNDVLSNSTWLAGETFSLADVAWAPYITRLDWLGMGGMWTDNRPAVANWYINVQARDSYRMAITDFVPPKEIAILRKYGGLAWQEIKAMLDALE